MFAYHFLAVRSWAPVLLFLSNSGKNTQATFLGMRGLLWPGPWTLSLGTQNLI